MRIGFVALAMLVVCSLLAGAVAFLPFGELFGSDNDDGAGNFENANDDLIDELLQQVEDDPEDLESVLLLANVLGNSGRLDEAIPHYERAIGLAPDDPSVRRDFAQALAGGGFHADAELQFQRALELDPDNQSAMYYLAELYMRWEPPRDSEAIPLYERTITTDPDTFIADLARNRVSSITATPVPDGSPEAAPAATPTGDGTGG